MNVASADMNGKESKIIQKLALAVNVTIGKAKENEQKMKFEVTVSYTAIIELDAKTLEEVDKKIENDEIDEDKILQEVLDKANSEYGSPSISIEKPMKEDLVEDKEITKK